MNLSTDILKLLTRKEGNLFFYFLLALTKSRDVLTQTQKSLKKKAVSDRDVSSNQTPQLSVEITSTLITFFCLYTKCLTLVLDSVLSVLGFIPIGH